MRSHCSAIHEPKWLIDDTLKTAGFLYTLIEKHYNDQGSLELLKRMANAMADDLIEVEALCMDIDQVDSARLKQKYKTLTQIEQPDLKQSPPAPREFTPAELLAMKTMRTTWDIDVVSSPIGDDEDQVAYHHYKRVVAENAFMKHARMMSSTDTCWNIPMISIKPALRGLDLKRFTKYQSRQLSELFETFHNMNLEYPVPMMVLNLLFGDLDVRYVEKATQQFGIYNEPLNPSIISTVVPSKLTLINPKITRKDINNREAAAKLDSMLHDLTRFLAQYLHGYRSPGVAAFVEWLQFFFMDKLHELTAGKIMESFPNLQWPRGSKKLLKNTLTPILSRYIYIRAKDNKRPRRWDKVASGIRDRCNLFGGSCAGKVRHPA
jgi:hypothetical protein